MIYTRRMYNVDQSTLTIIKIECYRRPPGTALDDTIPRVAVSKTRHHLRWYLINLFTIKVHNITIIYLINAPQLMMTIIIKILDLMEVIQDGRDVSIYRLYRPRSTSHSYEINFVPYLLYFPLESSIFSDFPLVSCFIFILYFHFNMSQVLSYYPYAAPLSLFKLFSGKQSNNIVTLPLPIIVIYALTQVIYKKNCRLKKSIFIKIYVVDRFRKLYSIIQMNTCWISLESVFSLAFWGSYFTRNRRSSHNIAPHLTRTSIQQGF